MVVHPPEEDTLMKYFRPFVAVAAFLAASNAFAVGNFYITNYDDTCNWESVPANGGWVGYYSGGGNTIKVSIARGGQLIKARCRIKDHDLELENAVVFDPSSVPGRPCQMKISGYNGSDFTTFRTFDYSGNLTPSGNAHMKCTCDLDNGCTIIQVGN